MPVGLCLRLGVPSGLDRSCSLSRSRRCSSPPPGQELCSPGAPGSRAFPYGRRRDLSGSLATPPAPLPCSETPAESVAAGHVVAIDAAPDPTRRRLRRFHDFEAATGLQRPLSTLHERRCRRPCRTRFRLAGSAFAGRASNPLGRFERFQVTSILLSRAYPDASWSHVRRRFYELAVGGASRRSIETRTTFAAEGLNNGATFARPERDLSSPISSRGCARSSASSARRVNSPRRSAMRSRVGRALPGSSTTAESRSTPTRSSARSDPSPLIARMRSSPAPTAAGKTGRSSPRWSKPASSTASIPTSISPTRSPRSSTAISTARSTISCHGPT